MNIEKAMREAAEALNAAIDKFNLVTGPEEQDAAYYDIEAAKARINAIVRKAKEADSA